MNQFPPPSPSPGIAALLEIGCGLFLQTFGIGHIYTGRVLRGLILMFLYWILQAINFVLCWALVGFVTMGLTWLAFVIFSPLWAAGTARRS